jgi:hypothetical protein
VLGPLVRAAGVQCIRMPNAAAAATAAAAAAALLLLLHGEFQQAPVPQQQLHIHEVGAHTYAQAPPYLWKFLDEPRP